jgi:2,4-dienoyl-CoA reductase-like NADH-dependent reductase (Old Yellow Enzyme family)
MELPTLFSSKKIGNVKMKNRLVRSATLEGLCEKYGYINSRFLDFHEQLANGGVGLIITGAVAVDPSGSGGPYQSRIDNESYEVGHKNLTKLIHNFPDTKVAIQLIHTGRQGYHPKYQPVAPSAVLYPITKLMPRALNTEEIDNYIKMFVQASIRAYECGYDMVQLHASHGYFLSNFLSPYTNKRTDKYGGNVENMVRIIVEIYNQTRDQLGKEFPLLIKSQVNDFVPGGLDFDTGIKIVEKLTDTGFDAIEPSGGIGETPILTKLAYPSNFIKKPEEENYFLPFAKKIKPIMKNSALILVGGIKNPLTAEKILKNQWADFISMSRPLIREPNLPNRWQSGDLTPAECTSCNSCFDTMGTGLYCVIKRRLEEKLKKE